MLSIGTKTQWGIIQAIGFVGERYYWIVDKFGTVSMFPANFLEFKFSTVKRKNKKEL